MHFASTLAVLPNLIVNDSKTWALQAAALTLQLALDAISVFVIAKLVLPAPSWLSLRYSQPLEPHM